MNITQAQQKALDDALVAHAGHLKEILYFCPKVPGQKFEDLSLEHDILSFIRDLRHTGDITYLTYVNVDYLHQPWRAFATVINKCLSGKETGMDKICLHKDTQVYGTIFPKELINQTLLESNAYKTYYAFASGDKTPKLKYIRKKVDSDTSPKKKPIQATKGTRIKSKVKVSKSDKKKQPTKKPKAKGLAVLSEVALTEAEQLKLATKRSKIQFHSSHTSGSGDRVDTQSKVPDKQHLETTGANEGTSTIPGVSDVPIYESESEKESWGESEDKDEDNENDYDDLSDEGDDDNNGNDDDDDDNNDDKQEGDDTNNDNEETDSDRTDKLLNLENPSPADNEIASLMETLARHAMEVPKNISCFTTTILPPPLFFNPLLQQATLTPTPTTSEATTSFPLLMDFSSVFRFNNRVTNLEKDLSEIKQVDQYAQALSSILAIVDRYMDNKLGELINKSILAYNLDCRQEA
ncbi:hypothetical protein Tco_0331509 [Tanacetum coccineum]